MDNLVKITLTADGDIYGQVSRMARGMKRGGLKVISMLIDELAHSFEEIDKVLLRNPTKGIDALYGSLDLVNEARQYIPYEHDEEYYTILGVMVIVLFAQDLEANRINVIPSLSILMNSPLAKKLTSDQICRVMSRHRDIYHLRDEHHRMISRDETPAVIPLSYDIKELPPRYVRGAEVAYDASLFATEEDAKDAYVLS